MSVVGISFWIWMIASFVAMIYCVVRGIVDLRRKQYAWGVIGLASGVVLMLTPIQTHAVKIDLPGPATAR